MHAVLKCTLTSVGYVFCFVTFSDCAFTCSIACVNTVLADRLSTVLSYLLAVERPIGTFGSSTYSG
jgi:hypothetical protein